MSLGRNIRDLKPWVMASNRLVFYESVSSGGGTLTNGYAVWWTAAASGVPFVITATAKKDKMLADLIIDKVLINSASPIRIDTIYQASLAMSVMVRVCDRKQRANERVGADENLMVANAILI